MGLPRISIVIPAYNAASFLEDALASVRALQYPPDLLEAIVVDDGSTDETASVATSAMAKLPFAARLVRQENSGPSGARNAGWRQAKGEWVQFLDADDELAPGKLAVQGSSAGAAARAVACIYSPWRREVAGGGGKAPVYEMRDPVVEGDTMLELIRTENFVPWASALASRVWLERVGGFDESLRFIEDVDLQLRLSMAGGRFLRVANDAPLFTYRHRAASLSLSNRLEFFRGCVRNARLAERHWRGLFDGIGPKQKEVLLSIYENALPVFAQRDPIAFEATFRNAMVIAPDFRPGSTKLRLLGGVIGTRNAYRLLGAIRRLEQYGK